jgi:hypothetical protein
MPAPDQFSVTFAERPDPGPTGSVVRLFYNGRQIGNDLTDNAYHPDGYRYHDVFHFGCAVFLDVNYVTDALFSIQDNGASAFHRADKNQQRIEEVLSILAFTDAVRKNYFADTPPDDTILEYMENIASAQLKRPDIDTSRWRDTLGRIYDVFRPLHDHRGGVVSCDRAARRMVFRPAHP